MSHLTEKIELDNVDSDIREAYLPLVDGRYRTGEPTEIQTVRLLRELNKNLAILIKLNKNKNVNEESFNSLHVDALNSSILEVDDCRHKERDPFEGVPDLGHETN